MRSDHQDRTGPSANRAKTSARVRAAVGVLVVLAGLTTPTTSALAQTPMIEFIQPSAGFTFVSIRDIADDGTVVALSYSGSGPGTSPVLRYSPGGNRVLYPSGTDARISGNAQVIGIKTLGGPNGPIATLHYTNGSQRVLPGVVYQGQLRTGGVSHLNIDGTVAMLGVGTGVSNESAYRWTLDGNTTSLPPIPGGSTWNRAYGMSSDGSIVVGEQAPNSSVPAVPMSWTGGGSTLDTVLDPNGQAIFNGRLTAISGDGTKKYGVYNSGQFASPAIMITNGVTTPLELGDLAGFTELFPSGASYDGSVLVGSLGAQGSWVWTESTGAMRAADFFAYHGVDVNLESFFTGLVVSGDGLHFAGRSGPTGGALVTIPMPGTLVSLILGGTLATTRRRR
ncbi:MAG: hypothetical protein IPK69_04595 [Phycisphaerales bacterium]|nr:MAG: hypothetical protein IPK69_04595 [Phycisphaerales bacterium]